MSDFRKAVVMAVEQLGYLDTAMKVGMPEYGYEDEQEFLNNAITALRDALEAEPCKHIPVTTFGGDYCAKCNEPMEAEPQEPYCWAYTVNGAHELFSNTKPPEDAYDEGSLIPLYAQAPKGQK